MEKAKVDRQILYAILALGAVLRAWQYFGNPSLWIDEIAIARQIIERPFADLLSRPLDFNQVAPKGFLAAIKFATATLGDGELALRLIPFAAGLASLPVFLALVRRTLPSTARAPVMLIFGIAPNLILRSADVKQYSTDILAATAVALLVLRWLEQPTRGRGWALGATLGLGAWFSHPLVLVGAGVLPSLALDARRRGALGAFLSGAAVVAASVFGASLVAKLSITPGPQSALEGDWSRGFVPWDFVGAIRWALSALPRPFEGELGVGQIASYGYAALVPLGWLKLGRGRLLLAGVIIGPVVVTLLAAVVHQYPFARRQVTFLLPSAVIAIGAALDMVGGALKHWHPRMARLGWVAVVPVMMAAFDQRPVIRREDGRGVFEYLAGHRRDGDPVYVYFTGWQAATYYAPRATLDSADVYIGRCSLDEPGGYRFELNRFVGARPLWVFFAHEANSERRQIITYLHRIGVAIDSVIVPRWPQSPSPSASAWQFDLSTAGPGADTAPSAPSARCRFTGPGFPVDSLLRGWKRLPPA